MSEGAKAVPPPSSVPTPRANARARRPPPSSWSSSLLSSLPYAVLALLNVIYFACMSLNAAAPPALERLLPQPDSSHSALIVTAHPDDESMFFAPTVLALTKAGWDVSALCTAGDAAGLGGIREQELYAAYEILGVSKDKVQVADTPSDPPRQLDMQLTRSALQDGMNTAWDVSTAGKLVCDRLQQSPVSVVITFDGQGISGHANHIAASEACSPLHWPAQPSSTPRVYNVISPSLYAKYLGPLPGWVDLLLADIDQYAWAKGIVAWIRADGAPAGLRVNSSPPAWLKSTKAMRAHKTQLVWYRWLWLGFSSLQWTNELVEV